MKSYYDSIDHEKLLSMLNIYVKDDDIIRLVRKYLARTVEKNGACIEIKKGIAMGSPLSPLMGTFYLSELDSKLEETGLFHVRYMDDILIMAPTRWKLKRAVKIINEELNRLGLRKHPDKTFIGRVENGFDFLGYHIGLGELKLAKKRQSIIL